MAFGKEIKRLRLKANISAQKMSDILGVGTDKLRQWEARNSDPKDDRDIQNIEKAFRMSIENILTLDSLPKYVKSNRADTEELMIEFLSELLVGQRVMLSILAELQAPLMKEKTLPAQLLGIYRKMVKDDRTELLEEVRLKLKIKP